MKTLVQTVKQVGGVLQTHAVGHGQAVGRGGGDVFGITAAGQQGADLIANLRPADAFAGGDDFA
jgi:hypothetical protein